MAVFALCALIFFFYVFVQYVVRVKYSNTVIKISKTLAISPYVQSRIWNGINIVLGVGIVIGAYAYSESKDDFADFG